MLAEEHRFRVREILSGQRTVTASDLCTALGVTVATVRRDLAALEHTGVLVRSHGGAVSRMSSTNFQPSYEPLSHSHSSEKQAIAREAERLVLDGETVFLEGSTTVYELARGLNQRNRLTVVTNSPAIVCQSVWEESIRRRWTMKRTGRDLLPFVLPVLRVAVAVPPVALGQKNSGGVAGTVRDSAGAVTPDTKLRQGCWMKQRRKPDARMAT